MRQIRFCAAIGKVAALVCFVIALSSQQPLSVPVDDPNPGSFEPLSKPSETSVNLSMGMQNFTLDLYKSLVGGTSGNLVFSPFSISTALMMVYLGARGTTATAMQQTLHIPKVLSPKALGEFAHYSLQRLSGYKSEHGYDVKIANRLWGQESFPFVLAYMDLLHRYFWSGLARVDFVKKREAARQQINQWTAKQSGIENLIKPDFLNNDTRLVLTNAIYFLGEWDKAFSHKSTKNEDFFVDTTKNEASRHTSEIKKVATMRTTLHARYATTPDLQIAELGYKSSHQNSDSPTYALTILLPKDRYGMQKLEETLSRSTLVRFTDALKPKFLDVSLPKVRLESNLDLSKGLTQLGMGLAFDRNAADFSGMVDAQKGSIEDRRLVISKVVHKTYLSLTEAGTEAAAATAVGMERLMSTMPMEKPIRFQANHPFIFVLRDVTTGTILFIGRLMQP